MLSLPIAHHKALESQLIFQKIVEHLGVLATIGVVDLVVGTVWGLDNVAEVHVMWKTYHMIDPTPARTASANGQRYNSCMVTSSILAEIDSVML